MSIVHQDSRSMLRHVMTFLDAEHRSKVARVSRAYHRAVVQCRLEDAQKARSFRLGRSLGLPGTSPFGLGATRTGPSDTDQFCAVYRRQQATFASDTGDEIGRRQDFNSYPLLVRTVEIGKESVCLGVMFDDREGEAVVQNVATGRQIQSFALRELPGLCWPIALSPCGKLIAFPFRQYLISIGDLTNGTSFNVGIREDFRPLGVGFSIQGDLVGVSGHFLAAGRSKLTGRKQGNAGNMQMFIYDVKSRQLVTHFEIIGLTMSCRDGFVEFSPGGRLVLVPSKSGIAVINIAQRIVVYKLVSRPREASSWTKENNIIGHAVDNPFAAFANDGSFIVTTRERTGWVQVWETCSGRELCAIPGVHYWAWPTRRGILTSVRGPKGWQIVLLEMSPCKGKRRRPVVSATAIADSNVKQQQRRQLVDTRCHLGMSGFVPGRAVG